MDQKRLSLDGDLGQETTRISFTKSPVSSLRKTSRDYVIGSFQIQEILEKTGFFQRPDIIPYPFLINETETSKDKLKNERVFGKKEGGKKKEKPKKHRKKSRLLKNEGSWGCDQVGIQCDTCVRVHKHKWAVIDQ